MEIKVGFTFQFKNQYYFIILTHSPYRITRDYSSIVCSQELRLLQQSFKATILPKIVSGIFMLFKILALYLLKGQDKLENQPTAYKCIQQQESPSKVLSKLIEELQNSLNNFKITTITLKSDNNYNEPLDEPQILFGFTQRRYRTLSKQYECYDLQLVINQMEREQQQSSLENQLPVWNNQEEYPSESDEEKAQKPTQSFSQKRELLQARTRLVIFIQALGQLRKTQIRRDILEHVQQINKNKKIISSYISDETVVRIVTCRIEKMAKNKRIKKNWSEDDIKILVWVVSKYSELHSILNLEKDLNFEDWERISQLIPGVCAKNCLFKWLSLKKVNLSSFSWSPQQSNLLKNIIDLKQQLGHQISRFTNLNWRLIAQELYTTNNAQDRVFRSAKQCREHWNCFLNPKLKKGPWLIEEDVQLLSLIRSNNGQKKWSQIVYSFEGRTQNALKNRYTLLIQKQKRISKSKQQSCLIEDCLQFCYEQQMKSKNFESQIIIKPMTAEVQVQHFLCEANQSNDSKQSLQNQKSQENTITSSPPLIKTTSEMKIHYLTQKEHHQFLEWIRNRNDLKKCCLKNGSLQIEE